MKTKKNSSRKVTSKKYNSKLKHKKKSKNIKRSKKYNLIGGTNKIIYIKNNAGFGNKVFDLIFAVYLYNLYNQNSNKCKIYYVLVKSQHENEGDPTLDNIFLNSNTKINYITEQDYTKISKDNAIIMHKLYNDNPLLQDLKTFPKYEDLEYHTKIDNNFRLVYEMYKTFSNDDKILFSINTELFNEGSTLITEDKKINIDSEYAIVHIRYGDKLLSNEFITYTPEYYIDNITILQRVNPKMKIYIITDSIKIVNNFILNEKSNPRFNENVEILNIHWLYAFYLIYYAKYIIMSLSTFCIAGSYFNEKKPLCKILIPPLGSLKYKIQPEQYAMSPEWKISNNIDKYMLNSNYYNKLRHILARQNKNIVFRLRKNNNVIIL